MSLERKARDVFRLIRSKLLEGTTHRLWRETSNCRLGCTQSWAAHRTGFSALRQRIFATWFSLWPTAAWDAGKYQNPTPLFFSFSLFYHSAFWLLKLCVHNHPVESLCHLTWISFNKRYLRFEALLLVRTATFDSFQCFGFSSSVPSPFELLSLAVSCTQHWLPLQW